MRLGVQTLQLCISNHIKTKYQKPSYSGLLIRIPIVQQLTLTFTYNIAPISNVSILYISFLDPTQHLSSLSTRWSMVRSPNSLQMRPLLRGKDARLTPCLTPKADSGGQQKHLTRHPNFRTAIAFVGWSISHNIRQQRGGRLDEATHKQTMCWLHSTSRLFLKKKHSIPEIMSITFAT